MERIDSNFPKILFLGTQMSNAGAQRILFTLAEYFHRSKYRVEVAFVYDKDNLRNQWENKFPFPVIDLNGYGGRFGIVKLPLAVIRLWLMIRRSKFDIVHTFTPHANLIGLFLAWLAGVRVRVGSHHGAMESTTRVFNSLHGKFINSRFVHKQVVVSESVANLTVEKYNVDPDKNFKILNGIEPFPIIDRLKVNEAKAQLGIALSAPILLTVGRLENQKQHIVLLETMPAILEQFTDTLLLVAGNGPLLNELEEVCRRQGLEESVRFLGMRDDIDILLNLADVFVMPSRIEGLPLSLLEAMGTGLPVVVSNIGPMQEIVRNEIDGFVVPLGDVQQFAQKINILLSNAELREKMGASARERILKDFNDATMCAAYEALFLELLEKNDHGIH
jgi:glycosyltransferase involved in cell wall biosynthesis